MTLADHVHRVSSHRRSALWRIMILAPLIGACAINPDEFVVRADSISVAPPSEPTGSVTVRFHGRIGADACHELKRVERTSRSDSLVLRFIGQARGGLCEQVVARLTHQEMLANTPARRLNILVEQPSGPPLARLLVFPLQ